MTDNSQRNAAILRMWRDGQTYGQIAKELAVSRNTVAGVISRERHKQEAAA